MQLHSIGEIQRHVAQIRTLIGQLMEDRSGDLLASQLNVTQLSTESDSDKSQEGFYAVDLEL